MARCSAWSRIFLTSSALAYCFSGPLRRSYAALIVPLSKNSVAGVGEWHTRHCLGTLPERSPPRYRIVVSNSEISPTDLSKGGGGAGPAGGGGAAAAGGAGAGGK